MATSAQLSFWNMEVPKKAVWNDVRLPEAFYAYFKDNGCCPNCRQPLRHYMHALNHFKKLHNKPRFFVWYFNMWNEVSQAAWARAKKRHVATARTK